MGQLNCCGRRNNYGSGNKYRGKTRNDHSWQDGYDEWITQRSYREVRQADDPHGRTCTQERISIDERVIRQGGNVRATLSARVEDETFDDIDTKYSSYDVVKVGQQRFDRFGAQSSSSDNVKVAKQPSFSTIDENRHFDNINVQTASSSSVKVDRIQRLDSIKAQSSLPGNVKVGQQRLDKVGLQNLSCGSEKVEHRRLDNIGSQTSFGSVKVGQQQLGSQSSSSRSVKVRHQNEQPYRKARSTSSHTHSRRPSRKARRQITLYHYTTKRNAMNIKRENFIRGSDPSTPFQYRRYGDGVYFTTLSPEISPDKLALNNFTNRGTHIYGTGLYKKIQYVVRINFDNDKVRKIHIPQRDVYLHEGSIDLTQYEGRYKIYENQRCPMRSDYY